MEDSKDDKSRMERLAHAWREWVDTLVRRIWFGYAYMICVLMFTLLCGYLLYFAGSLLFEAVMEGWYNADATDTDATSFLLGYLYGFPSLLGVIGGIAVISTAPRTLHRFKILLFVPAAIWSALLVFDLIRNPTYWSQLFYHIPAMVLCFFVLFGVIEKATLPYLSPAGRE